MVLRALARPLLASWFVYSGVSSYLEPEPRAAKVGPVVEPMLADSGLSDVKTTDLVRAHGIATAVTAVALATSRTPRTAALLLATLSAAAVPLDRPFWNIPEGPERDAEREQFLKNLALFGGVLLAGTVGHTARHKQRKKAKKAKAKEKAIVAKEKAAIAKSSAKAAKKKRAE